MVCSKDVFRMGVQRSSSQRVKSLRRPLRRASRYESQLLKREPAVSNSNASSDRGGHGGLHGGGPGPGDWALQGISDGGLHVENLYDEAVSDVGVVCGETEVDSYVGVVCTKSNCVVDPELERA